MVDTYKHKGMRKALVRLLKGKGISDITVLQALESVPRHYFFESVFLEHAYQDKAFPIGEGQTISQPYTVAFQTELLQAKPKQKILEIGTGSGYQACVLMELGVYLYSIEYNQILFERTKQFLPRIGYAPKMYCGDGSRGFPRYAPYDGIIVTAGAPTVPDILIDQLKPGGRLVIPVGNNKRQSMLRLTKDESGKTTTEEFDYFAFVPLKGENGWK